VTLAGISERQKISLSYLEQLFGKLRRHRIVGSVRGPGGGYCLAKPHGHDHRRGHHRRGRRTAGCHPAAGRRIARMQRCMTHELWTTLNEKMFEYLRSVSLGDLVAQQREKSGVSAVLHDERPMRRIRRPAEELAAA
jgi:Rrf2 family iron-sulfur cluster assembly transcriptional regulator